MAYVEVEVTDEMYKFELNKPLEGEYKQIEEKVGPNESNIYTVGTVKFWGTSALDLLMSKVKIGDKLRITLVNESKKFPSGRIGKDFKLEVDK